MGLFSRKKEVRPSDWKTLNTDAQLEQLIEDSHSKTVVLFKHSVTCGISAMAEYRLQNEWKFEEGNFDFYYLDLLAHRPISNKIAEVLRVTHQSPQVIVVRNGEAIAATSHQAISVDWLEKSLAKAEN